MVMLGWEGGGDEEEEEADQRHALIGLLEKNLWSLVKIKPRLIFTTNNAMLMIVTMKRMVVVGIGGGGPARRGLRSQRIR